MRQGPICILQKGTLTLNKNILYGSSTNPILELTTKSLLGITIRKKLTPKKTGLGVRFDMKVIIVDVT